MNKLVKALTLVLLGSICTVAAWGHDTWLLPEHAAVAPGTEVSLDLTSGMAFPALDSAIKADRVACALLRLAGKTTGIDTRKTGAKSLQLSTRLGAPGVATLAVSLHPKAIEFACGRPVQHWFGLPVSAALPPHGIGRGLLGAAIRDTVRATAGGG